MKDWVKPTLLALRPETISEQSYEDELRQPVFCWRRLVDIFHHNLVGEARDVVGSVLGDLPVQVFDKLVEIRARFIYMDSLGLATRFSRDESAMIFTPELLTCGWMAGRGIVIHEISHHYRDDPSAEFSLSDPYGQRRENATDILCIEWGFEEEIIQIRKYLSTNERRKRND
jgi:hypothetical protein